MFDLLVASGADVNSKDSEGLTPLMVALHFSTQLKAQWLLGAMTCAGGLLQAGFHWPRVAGFVCIVAAFHQNQQVSKRAHTV
jgi:hypothetical protein